MPGPLLDTKMHIPRRRRGVMARSRLSDRLNAGWDSKVTLISAPAGFGKTTVLTEWLADASTEGLSSAWLSLDDADNDPVLFWTYLVLALDSAAAGVGAGARALLRSPQPPMDAVLTTLINDLDVLTNDVVLVLDDYHVIEAPGVHEGMTFFLEHLPEQVHVVIASRADPPLPLARFRARGELGEVRISELRFTPEEAAAYLNGVMGLAVTASDVAALEGRTEGWIAALQLAALSMQGRDDIAAFIGGFAGDDRYIVDYLIEEVLQRQPERVRTFLLQTSVLSRMNGSLCDTLTGGGGGDAMLDALDRSNLFLVPLDDRRHWYRYHHLFAEVLRARLVDEQPERIPALHTRAADWYDRNGQRSEAIHHALAGEDYERAAELIELAIPDTRRDRREATLRGWLELLPEAVVSVRPVLDIGYIGALMSTGDVEGGKTRLRAAERWLEPTAEVIVADDEAFGLIPATIEMYRAAQALISGDARGAMQHARLAVDLSPEGDHLPQAGGTALLGLASWSIGDLEEAGRAYSESMDMMRRAGHLSDLLGCALAVADIQLARGSLSDAKRTYERALELADAGGAPGMRGTADMHVGLSELHRERNDMQAATRHLLRHQELGAHAGLPQDPYRWRVAMAGMKRASGELDAALELLDEAQRVYTGDFSPNVRPIPALKARLQIERGAFGDAAAWLRETGLSVDDDLTYLREFEHITLARVLLAAHPAGKAGPPGQKVLPFLQRLLAAAEAGSRTRSVLEILVLQALAHQSRQDLPSARACLERALALGEPEGYARIFLDEGQPLQGLLKAAAKQGSAASYARHILAAASTADDVTPSKQGLIDPLSERELDVLRLLGTDLNGPDIARELVVSLNTVRTHTKNIYTKLGVNSRRAAVRRGEQLDLLARSR